jgi:adenylate cyclase
VPASFPPVIGAVQVSTRKRELVLVPPVEAQSGICSRVVSEAPPTPERSPAGDRSDYWTEVLSGTDSGLNGFQRALRRVPAPPRCKLCQAPFSGPYAPVFRLLGFRRWALNQQICRFCVRDLEKHSGGAEITVSLVYVDIRGSTEIAEQLNPRAYSDGLNRYLALVAGEVDSEHGVIDHMAGDGVMAMWIPAFVGDRHPKNALKAAVEIARRVSVAVDDGSGFPAGAGVHTGLAYVGVVGEPGARDFTVLGDTANTVARLSAAADPGQVVLSQSSVDELALDPSNLERRSLNLKGKSEPFTAWAWTVGETEPVGLAS